MIKYINGNESAGYMFFNENIIFKVLSYSRLCMVIKVGAMREIDFFIVPL